MPGTSVGSCIVIAEIGQNHNGDLSIAKKLIDVAVDADCDYVKFAKRTPELSVPKHMWDTPRDTPWGTIPYIDYRKRIEFGREEYGEIEAYCKKAGIAWFASSSDIPSLEFLEKYDPPFCKIPSAKMNDDLLLIAARNTGRPIIASTGICSIQRILHAMDILAGAEVWLAQCTSAYPAPNDEINLLAMNELRAFGTAAKVGYSGHEIGLQITLAAVAMGAEFVERHITLARSMWGTDHAASVEPDGLRRLVKDIRVIEAAMGDGEKKKMPCEEAALRSLRVEIVDSLLE